MMPPLSFRPARLSDVDAIVQLVNSAYRGDTSRAGWTTEADLLSGQRTDAEEILGLLTAADSLLLLAESADAAATGSALIGSVHLQKCADHARIGMFVVHPKLQARGIGKRFLQEAEQFIRQTWGMDKIRMLVIYLRTELIAYYERRGYNRTGQFEAFPTSHRFGIPLVKGLRLEVLEKQGWPQ